MNLGFIGPLLNCQAAWRARALIAIVAMCAGGYLHQTWMVISALIYGIYCCACGEHAMEREEQCD